MKYASQIENLAFKFVVWIRVLVLLLIGCHDTQESVSPGM